MRIVEIKALSNGSHRNQTGEFNAVPEGYAVIPDGMITENFPFGEIEVEQIDGVRKVTKWTPGVIPEIEETEKPISETEQLRADVDYIAVMMGVDL